MKPDPRPIQNKFEFTPHEINADQILRNVCEVAKEQIEKEETKNE
jgi:hypothetical protein